MARPYLRGDQCARRRQTRPPHWRHATAHGKALALTISLTFLGRADEVTLSGADTRSAHGLDRSSNSSCLQSSRSCKPTSHSGRRPSTAGRRAAASRMPATARCMSPSPKSRFRRSRRNYRRGRAWPYPIPATVVAPLATVTAPATELSNREGQPVEVAGSPSSVASVERRPAY
jgi:hypothetical protein